jgi:hypothetical protein
MPRATLLLLLTMIGYGLAVNDVIVYNLKLFVDGTEFIIKGFNYQPAPVRHYIMPNGVPEL